jgi:tetratricopeptide (TPR) repeat protein
MKRENYIRIAFRLNTQLFTQLDRISQSQAQPKSKIILSWLQNIHNESEITLVYPDNKTKTYNLFLPKSTVENLDSAARKYGVSRSELICRTIARNIHRSVKVNADEQPNINSLYQKGLLGQIASEFNEKVDKLSTQDLLIYINSTLQHGNLKEIDNLLDLLITRKHDFTNDNLLRCRVNIFKARKYKIIGKLRDAEDILNATLPMGLNLGNRKVLGEIFFQLGRLQMKRDSYDLAPVFLNRVLEYLDIINHPFLFVDVYVQLIKIALYNRDFIKAEEYINKAFSLLQGNDNYYYTSMIKYEQGILAYLQNDISRATKIFEENTLLCIKSGSINRIYNNYEALSISYYLAKKDFLAWKIIRKSEEYINKMNINMVISFTSMFRPMIEMKDNYERSINQLDTIMERNKYEGNRPHIYKYLYFTSKYLNSSNELENDEAVVALKKMSVEGPYETLRYSSYNTLNRNTLQSIR